MSKERYQVERRGLGSALWHVIDTHTGRPVKETGYWSERDATREALYLNGREAGSKATN